MSATVAQELERHAEQAPDRPFVKVGGDRWYSFADLADAAARVAAGLTGLGVGRGDRVALICTNRIEAVVALFACAHVGAVLVPLNHHLRGEFLAHQLTDCAPSVVVVDGAGAVMSAGLLDRIPGARLVLLDPEAAVDTVPGTASWSDLFAGAPAPRDTSVTAGDPVAIIYTSGTTGLPKGCVLSHGYYLNAARAVGPAELVGPGDRVITPFPHFHASLQMNTLMAAMVCGGSLVLEPEFHASTFIDRAREEGATVAWGIAAMGLAILAQDPQPSDRDHTLRLAIWATLAPEAQHVFEERFGARVTAEIYGQTEAVPITVERPDAVSRLPFAEGRASVLYDVQVVDTDDAELPAGQVGEIVVRPRVPHAMFSGYWQRPADTVATIRNLWHHTGDLGRLDTDGRLFFVDRKKDSLRRRGENVSCYQLEDSIRSQPGVVDVAATGVPSPLGDDDIKISLVCTDDAPRDPQAWFDVFRATLPYFAVPRYVEIRDVLPRTDTGKVLKDVLRGEGIHAGLWDLEDLGLVVARADRRR